MSEQEVRQARLEKLAQLRRMGINPYPARIERTHTAADVRLGVDELAASGDAVSIAGRIVGFRGHGKTAFVDLSDESGRIQVYLRQDELGEGTFDLLKLADLGDFLAVQGQAMRTRTNEPTVRAVKTTIITKTISPLPEKYHGLSDLELRSRRRELDLIANEDAKQTFDARSCIVRALREHLWGQGYREVETPILQHVYGGAEARPFVTHHHTLDADLYMRIAVELFHKRLLVGGYERVFEIGRVFRNEGMDRSHSPEYTLLEAYEAYGDYRSMMRLTEGLILAAIDAHDGERVRNFAGRRIDFSTPWREVRLTELLAETGGVDILTADENDLRAALSKREVEFDESDGRGKLIDLLFTDAGQPTLHDPTYVVGYPMDISPLAKADADGCGLVERFELFIGGIELVNAFTENNDPVDQRQRLESQARFRVGEDDETPPVDEAFLSALDVGMPPAGGMGMGVDRLVMLLTDRSHIRDVILFPHLRSQTGKSE